MANQVSFCRVIMSTIKFSSTEKELLVTKIQGYFAKELDQDLGQFDAEFLLDFFSKEVDAHFYKAACLMRKQLLPLNWKMLVRWYKRALVK